MTTALNRTTKLFMVMVYKWSLSLIRKMLHTQLMQGWINSAHIQCSAKVSVHLLERQKIAF